MLQFEKSLTLEVINQVFNENPGYQIGEWRAVGWAGGRILNGVKLWRQTVVSAQ